MRERARRGLAQLCRGVLVSVGLVTALLGASVGSPQPASQVQLQVTVQTVEFCDVAPDYLPYVRALYLAGITSGCRLAPECVYFCPADPITREQMAVFLCRAAGKGPLNKEVPTFADVPKSSMYYAYVERLADAASWAGAPPTGGCRADDPETPENEALFCPRDPVTREQMAKFLCLASSRSAMPSCSGLFQDVPASNTFCPFIERMADGASWPGGVAVTSGCACPGSYPPGARCYCPKQSVTRGQMAVFLCRAFGIST